MDKLPQQWPAALRVLCQREGLLFSHSAMSTANSEIDQAKKKPHKELNNSQERID